MSIGSDGSVLRQLSSLFHLGAVGGLTDGQLLERFTTGPRGAAEGAFDTLIQRHGPMVWQTCRGVLTDRHDAEDAFQATFLVLVKKARGLWVQDSLGPWLHQVAHRTASAARAASLRRREHERRMASSATVAILPPGEGAGIDGEWGWRVLHEEIARLPERYRAPMVLCGLEGLTQEQAAQRLRWPVGTVKSRLARGRQRLRARLMRRGLGRSAGVPAVIFSLEAARAGVPAALAGATVRAAIRIGAGEAAAGMVPAAVIAMAEGVLGGMIMTKLKAIVFSVLLVSVSATGVMVVASQETDRPQAAPALQNPGGDLGFREARGPEVPKSSDHLRHMLKQMLKGDRHVVELASQGKMSSGARVKINIDLSHANQVDEVETLLELMDKLGPISWENGFSPSKDDRITKPHERRGGEEVPPEQTSSDPQVERRLREVERNLHRVLKAMEGSKHEPGPK